ncbi:MAG: hypothetical protein ACTHKH_12225 [Trinickia sp.]
MSNAPHIKFSWPVKSIVVMLEAIGIDGLGPLDESQSLTRWPQGEQWADYVDRLAAANGYLLCAPERDAIDSVLTRAEHAFNQLLAAVSPADETDRASAERTLREALESAQAQICRHREYPHAIYPYFARWFTLHLAALTSQPGADDHTAHVQGIGVWRAGRDYLEHAGQSACAQRMNQIGIAITGAHNDKLYVRDNRLDSALTHEVPAHGEEESRLNRVMDALRYEAAERYLTELSLKDGIDLLEHARSGVSVLAGSLIKQDELMEANEPWQRAQTVLHDEIDRSRTACGEWYERLVTVSLPTVQAQISGEAKIRTRRAAIEGYDVFSTMATGLVGMVPVVGSVLKPATGLLLKWLDGRPDPWVEFEEKMKGLIKTNLDAENARYIRNSLNGFDYELDLLFKEYDSSFQAGRLPNELAEFRRRIGAMSERLSVFTPHILNPRNFHATVPYFEHFFLLSVAINLTGEKINVKTYDFAGRRRKLYQMTETYLEYAINAASDERRSDIGFKNFDKGCNRRIGDSIYDYRLENKLSDSVQGFHADVRNRLRAAVQSAAGLVGASQLLRMPTMNAYAIVKNDKAAGFDAGRLESVYQRTMRNLHNQLKRDWATLEDPPHYNHKPYLHQDISMIESRPSYDYDDFAIIPPDNTLRIRNARPEDSKRI